MNIHTSKNATNDKNGSVAISKHVKQRLEDFLKLMGGNQKDFIDKAVTQSLDSNRSLVDERNAHMATKRQLSRLKLQQHNDVGRVK